MVYSIDTSALVFLDREYSYDVFRPLWDKRIIGLVNEGRLIASEEVKEELKNGDDWLYHWLKDNCDGMFVKTNTEIMNRVADVMTNYPNFGAAQKPSKNFADPFVLALAIEAPNIFPAVCQGSECVVVTYEQKSGNIRGPKLPDVCQACKVRAVKLIDVFKAEGWRMKG
jgi:hypothetical protein